MWRPPPMLRRVCNARSLLAELLVSDVEPLVSNVEPLVSDVEPLVSDVEPLVSDVEPLVSDVEPLVSDVEPLVSDVEPLVSDVEPLVSDVEATCRTSIASPLCPRLRRKDCVAQDRLLAEPRTVPEFVRRRALTTLHRSSTACLGSLHYTDAPAVGLTSLILSFTFAVYCPFSLLSPTVYPAFILQHSTTTTNDFNRSVYKWPLVDPSN